MSDNLKVAKECGLVVTFGGKDFLSQDGLSQLNAYTSRILASQQAAHDAEIAKLKEENQRVKTDSIVVVETLKADLAAANAACAMKDEALRKCAAHLRPTCFQLSKEADAAISSSQQVSEWERKQIEPLMRRIAELEAQINK